MWIVMIEAHWRQQIAEVLEDEEVHLSGAERDYRLGGFSLNLLASDEGV